MRRRAAAVLAATISMSPLLAGPVHAADEAIVSGDLRVDATVGSLGVVWFVSGDTDLDAEFRTLRFNG